MENLEIDLTIDDGALEIDLDLESGAPNYLAMLMHGNLTTINDTVTERASSIPSYAFYSKESIKEVNLQDAEEIGPYAFHKTNIEKLDIPNVTTVGEYAFSYITVSDEDGVLFLPKVENDCVESSWAFGYATAPKIVAPEYIGRSGLGAFNDGKAQKLILPKAKIAAGLQNMKELVTLYLPAATECSHRYSQNGAVRSSSNGVSSCNKLVNLVLPEVTNGGSGYLATSCPMLVNAYLPKLKNYAVRSNGNATIFNSCSTLRQISLPSLTNLVIDETSGTTYSYAGTIASNCPNLERIFLPNLEQAAFTNVYSGCPKIDGIFLPSLKRRWQKSATAPVIATTSRDGDFILYTPKLEEWTGYIIYSSASKINNFSWVIGNQESTTTALLLSQIWQESTSYKPYGEINLYVPDHLVDDYKNATNWSKYASYFKPQSEMPQELLDRIEYELTPPEEPDWDAIIEEAWS